MFRGTGLFVDAHEWSDGSVTIEGQDLRDDDEHEYFLTIVKKSLPVLIASLGSGPDADVLQMLADQGETLVRQGEEDWLHEHGIPFSYCCWP